MSHINELPGKDLLITQLNENIKEIGDNESVIKYSMCTLSKLAEPYLLVYDISSQDTSFPNFLKALVSTELDTNTKNFNILLVKDELVNKGNHIILCRN